MSVVPKRPRAQNESQYKTIEAWLEEQCRALPPGSPLPSEKQLSEMFQVSRMTVRHAMQALTASGRIERRQGLGTFVGTPELHRQDSVLYSFSEEMSRRGIICTSRVLATDVVVRPSVATLLGLPTDSWLVHVDRVRMANDIPLAREQVYLPMKYHAALEADLVNGSLHEALRNLGVTFAGANGAVTARLATDEELDLLKMTSPAALLVESRVVVDTTGEVIEHTETAYVGTRWAIDTSASVPGSAPRPTPASAAGTNP